MKKLIFLQNFSKNIVQSDIVGNGNNCEYYDTQIGVLFNYLTKKFPELNLYILAMNKDSNLKKFYYSGFKLVRLPFALNLFFSAIIYNLLSILAIISNRKNIFLIYIYTSSEVYPHLGALLISKLLKLPLFLCIRNPPESLCPIKPLSIFRAEITKFLDSFYFNNCDKIIHISQKSKELFKQNPMLYKKSIVLGSSPNEEIFNIPTKRENIKNIRFSYWGVVNKTRNLDVVLKGFLKAKDLDNRFNSLFYIFGEGDDLNRLKKLAVELNSGNIIFKEYVESSELAKFLQDTQVAVIPIPPTKFFEFSSPLKLAEAIMMEMPIIASNIEPNYIVKNENIGILCSHDEDSYAEAFLNFCAFDQSTLENFKENLRKIKYMYSTEYIFKDLEKAITDLLRSSQEV